MANGNKNGTSSVEQVIRGVNEEVIIREEQEALMRDMNNDKFKFIKSINFKNIPSKIWQLLHYPTKFNWLSILAIVAIVASIAATISVFSYKSNNKWGDDKAFAISKKMDRLYQSWTYYNRVATKEELLYTWIELFSNATYKQDGDPKKDQYDCVSSVFTFLRAFNSNVSLVDVPSLVHICENLAVRGELEIRKSIHSVRPGDLIVIQLQPNTPSHLGIVFDVKNNRVMYMHVNGKVLGSGFDDYVWGDPQVYGIYEVSYSLWVGSLLKEFNERRSN